MSKFLDYKSSQITLVEAGGGTVSEGLFVESPGVLLLSSDQGLTPDASRLFDQLNISSDQTDERRLAEFAARLTYLSFPGNPAESQAESLRLHGNLARLGHDSPYEFAATKPNVLVAGAALETCLELIANKYTIGRLTSSRTAAMNDPLLRIPAGDNDLRAQMREFSRTFLNLRNEFLRQARPEKPDREILEYLNMLNLGTKAGFMVVAATPDFWQKKLNRRLSDHSDGVESELKLILKRLADLLHPVHPDIIKPSSHYE